MPVRYTVTDSTGQKHTRTSARHLKPLYLFAVVRAPGVANKALVSFHGSMAAAQSALTAARKPMINNAFARKHNPELIGTPVYPGAVVCPVTGEVLPEPKRRA